MHRQKVAEVEKLSTTVAELEEAVLAGGAAVNAARDYQRQAQELLVRLYDCKLYWSIACSNTCKADEISYC